MQLTGSDLWQGVVREAQRRSGRAESKGEDDGNDSDLSDVDDEKLQEVLMELLDAGRADAPQIMAALDEFPRQRAGGGSARRCPRR